MTRLHLVAQWLETLLRLTIFVTVTISVLSILWPANSVTNNKQVKLHICFVIDEIIIKTLLERLIGKSLVCRNTYINIFTESHKVFLNEATVTFKKDPKKEKDIWCEHWKQWNLMGLISQIVCSRFILYFVCLLVIIFSPLLFLNLIIFIAL